MGFFTFGGVFTGRGVQGCSKGVHEDEHGGVQGCSGGGHGQRCASVVSVETRMYQMGYRVLASECNQSNRWFYFEYSLQHPDNPYISTQLQLLRHQLVRYWSSTSRGILAAET